MRMRCVPGGMEGGWAGIIALKHIALKNTAFGELLFAVNHKQKTSFGAFFVIYAYFFLKKGISYVGKKQYLCTRVRQMGCRRPNRFANRWVQPLPPLSPSQTACGLVYAGVPTSKKRKDFIALYKRN